MKGILPQIIQCINQAYWLGWSRPLDKGAQLLGGTVAFELLLLAFGAVLPFILLLRERIIVVTHHVIILFNPFEGMLLRHLLHLQLLLDYLPTGLIEQRFVDIDVVLDKFYLMQLPFLHT